MSTLFEVLLIFSTFPTVRPSFLPDVAVASPPRNTTRRESASDYAIWPAAHERPGKIDARRLAAYMPAHERFPYDLCRRQASSPS